MKKLVSFALAMLFALAVGVSGCGDDHSDDKKKPASDDKKKPASDDKKKTQEKK